MFTEKDWKILARQIRKLRIQSGFTQKEIGKLTGYGQQNISSFERGERNNVFLLCFYILYIDGVKDLFIRGDKNATAIT